MLRYPAAILAQAAEIKLGLCQGLLACAEKTVEGYKYNPRLQMC